MLILYPAILLYLILSSDRLFFDEFLRLSTFEIMLSINKDGLTSPFLIKISFNYYYFP